MIHINKGEENTVVLTLSEKVTLSFPFFLFVFKSDTTKDEVKAVIGDTSSYAYRYNEFVIDEGTLLTLSPTGYWHYSVYEQESSTNTDVRLTGNLLEVGKCHVDGTTVVRSAHIRNKQYVAYGTGA